MDRKAITKEVEAIVAEAFAAGQESMRNRAAWAAMDTVRSQSPWIDPVNLMGNVGRAIIELEPRALWD